MITLTCPSCGKQSAIDENRLKGLFVCPSCAHPLSINDKVMSASAAPLLASDKVMSAPALSNRLKVSTAPRTPQRMVPTTANVSSNGRRSVVPLAAIGSGIALVVVAGALLLGMRSPTPSADESRATPQTAIADAKGPLAPKGQEAASDVEVIFGIANRLGDPAPAIRSRALMELAGKGSQAHVVLPMIVASLKDDDATVQRVAQEALDKVGSPGANDLPLLSAALRDSAPEVQVYALASLEKLGPPARVELPYIRDLSTHTEPRVREAARLAQKTLETEYLGELTRGLKDSSASARHQALNELGQMGRAAFISLPEILPLLGDNNPAVVQACEETLAGLGSDWARTIAIGGLKHKDVNVRRGTLRALARMGDQARLAIGVIVVAAGDPGTRDESISALVEISRHAVPTLVAALKEATELPQRAVLVAALDRLGTDAAPALQLAAGSDPSDSISQPAKQILARAKEKKTVAAAEPTGKAGAIYRELMGMFRLWDKDGDESLSHEEVQLAFAKYNPTSAERKIRDYADTFVARLDLNGDKEVSRPEYDQWAREYAEQMAPVLEGQEREALAMQKLQQEFQFRAANVQLDVAAAAARAQIGVAAQGAKLQNVVVANGIMNGQAVVARAVDRQQALLARDLLLREEAIRRTNLQALRRQMGGVADFQFLQSLVAVRVREYKR